MSVSITGNDAKATTLETIAFVPQPQWSLPTLIVFPPCARDHHHLLPQVLSTPVFLIGREFSPVHFFCRDVIAIVHAGIQKVASLSPTKADCTLVGNVEKKGINQRSPTRTPNVAPTATPFAFPLPPTQIRPAPAKVVPEARHVAHGPAELSSQRLHNPIDRPFSASALTPATHACIVLLASAPPGLPSGR